MRYAALFSLLLISLIQSAMGQSGSGQDPYAEQTVRDALKLEGVSLSFTEKAFNRLGDRAAIGLTRVLADTPLTRPEEIKNILSFLRNAFAVPSVISNGADRQPKTTLFLLECLEVQPAARDLRGQVAETKAFVLQSVKHNRP
jgi:hypothetical protein